MNARFFRNFVVTGVPFGVFMGLSFASREGAVPGLISGIFCGLLFGISMAVFVAFQRKKFESQGADFEGEPILKQGPVNHFLKIESRGGWLILTPTRLVFRSHGVNIQNAPLEISLAEIEEAVPVLNLGVIPNGLAVKRKDGRWERFVVSGRKDWARRIMEQLGA